MVSIGIIITQSSISGMPGESREDIVIGSKVTLSNIDTEVTSYKWEIVGKPYASSAVLSSTTASIVTFTPDIIGSYLIQLTINNQLKQKVVAAILTSRYGIRIPAPGEGEEIYGGSFKAIIEAVRTLEEDSLNAAKIQGKDVSLNEPGLNDLLRFNGEEYVPSGKLRTDDVGFRNTQNVLVKIPLSSAIPANSYWEYSAGTSSIKPCWKTIPGGGALPVLDFSWNAFPHGSVLKKIYIVASCTNIESNSLTVKVGKRGAAWEGDKIVNLVDQFISTTTLSVDSISSFILTVDENTPFTHGNGNDDSVVSEELSIRITTDGNINHTFRIFGIYAHFQTLSIGLYNGPLVAEGGGGGGQEDGGGCCFSPAPFDFVLVPTTLTEEQNGEYFFCVGSPLGNGQITLPLVPTAGMQFTIMCAGEGITIDGNGTPMAGPMGLDWGAEIIGLESESSVTLTAKDLSPLIYPEYSPFPFVWVITGGIGEFFNNAVPTDRFNFNFNVPSNLPINTSSYVELLGWVGGGTGFVRMGKYLYDLSRKPTIFVYNDIPIGISGDPSSTQHYVGSLVVTSRNDSSVTPITITLDNFITLNDFGWTCTFMVGVNSDPVGVPLVISAPNIGISIDDYLYATSLTCSDVGAFITLKFTAQHVSSPYSGGFSVVCGHGKWEDDLGGIHDFSGGGSGDPVTLADSAITGGLSLTDQEIGFRAATTSLDGYLKHADWNTFNSKEPAQSKGSISETASSILTVTNGSSSTVGPNVTIQVKKASAIQDGYLGKDDFATFSSSTHNPVTLASSAVTGGLSLNDQEIGFRAATTSVDGYLKSADWNTFNSKEPAVTKGDLTSNTTSVISITDGTEAVIGTGTSITINKASAIQDGYLGKDDFVAFSSGGHNPVTLADSAITGGLSLSDQEIGFRAATTSLDGYLKSSDWNTFNSKEPAQIKGSISETASSILTVVNGSSSTVGPNVTIQVKKASALQDGYLGKDDFATFAAGGGGGDGYWSRDSVDGYLRPIITTDAIMVDKIGVGVSIVDSSAVVDIASTTKGILPPRMTTTQRNAIVSPVAGLQIFNTTTGKDNTYNGSSWEEVASGDVSSWSGTTTDGSVTELFLGGITNARYTLQANSTTVFQLLCVARDGTNNKSKVWKIEAVAQRDSSDNSSVVGTPTYTVVAQSDISGGTNDWDISVTVNDTDETFRVSVTGAAGTTISWTIRG